MKGLFLLLFLFVTSAGTTVSLILWSYVCAYRHKRVVTVCSIGITAVAVAGLWLYEERFYLLYDLPYVKVLRYGAAFSADWLLTMAVFLPIASIIGVTAFFIRLKTKRQGRKNASLSGDGPVTRRAFMKGLAALPLALGAVDTWGFIDGNCRLEVTSCGLSFPTLPQKLDGYRVGQISDCHIGVFLNPSDLCEAVAAVAAKGADILFVTGDILDEMCYLSECGAVLRESVPLFADGIFFCYGNHEYFRETREITAMLEKAGVQILRNEGTVVRPRRFPGTSFWLAGVDYNFARTEEDSSRRNRIFLEKALAGRPENVFTIVLAHHPDFFDAAAERQIPLTLAGHTHGGQIAPLEQFVRTRFKYLRGLYRKGECFCYVNRGTGHWLPLRLGCSREATIFTLSSGR